MATKAEKQTVLDMYKLNAHDMSYWATMAHIIPEKKAPWGKEAAKLIEAGRVLEMVLNSVMGVSREETDKARNAGIEEGEQLAENRLRREYKDRPGLEEAMKQYRISLGW